MNHHRLPINTVCEIKILLAAGLQPADIAEITHSRKSTVILIKEKIIYRHITVEV